MARIYKPCETTSWGTTSPVDPERCKAAVSTGYHNHQCNRKAVKGGWCNQHHPDAEAERKRQAAERWKCKFENSDAYKLKRALERIEELEKEVEALKCK